jgi:hypothetical protein
VAFWPTRTWNGWRATEFALSIRKFLVWMRLITRRKSIAC